jgi:hypothetical protein
MFCSHRLSKTIKSWSCKTINNFSLQKAVAGVSGEENLVAVKETSKKRGYFEKRVKGLQRRVNYAYKSHLVN